MKKIFLFFVLVLIGISTHGQITLSTSTSQLTACGGDTPFSITLTNNGSVAETVDNAKITVQLDNTVAGTVICTGITTAGVTNTGTPQQPVFSIPNTIIPANGGTYTIDYILNANCTNLNTTSATPQLTDNFILNYTNAGSNAVGPINTSQTYPFLYPLIIYNSVDPNNVNLTAASVNSPFTRTLAYVNTGTAPFTGILEFNDVPGQNAAVAITAVSILCGTTTNALPISAYNVNGGTVTINFAANNHLDPGCRVLISTNVTVTGCANNDMASSVITTNWGCTANNWCNTIVENPDITQSPTHPNLVINHNVNNQGFVCPGVPQNRFISITNNGTDIAYNVNFSLNPLTIGVNTIIPAGSIVIASLNGAMPTITSTITTIQDIQPNAPNYNPIQNQCVNTIPSPVGLAEYLIDQILPNQTITFNFDYIHCCAEQETLFNTPYTGGSTGLLYDWWFYNLRGEDICGVLTPVSQSFMGTTNIGLAQVNNSTITDLPQNSPPVEISIQNIDINDNSSIINFPNANLEIELEFDFGLNYQNGTLQIISSSGGIWTPVQENFSSGFLANSCEVILPATAPANATNSVTGVFDLSNFASYTAFQAFMEGSEVVFEMTTCCPATEPRTTYTQRVYWIPDNTCADACRIPVSLITKEINVHCPGCITPGIIGSSYEMLRTTFGALDATYNGLPDGIITPANYNQINRSRAVVGDHLTATWISHFQDGEQVGYNPMLINQIGGPLTGCYLHTVFTKGGRVQPTGARVTITPVSGTPLINFPLSTTTPAMSPDITFNATEVLVNAGSALAAFAALNGGIGIMPNDIIQIDIDYELTGNIYAPSIDEIIYNGRMYLTNGTYSLNPGTDYIANITEAPDDYQQNGENSDLNLDGIFDGLEALDGTEGYICEGFGGSFFQVAFTSDQTTQGFNQAYTVNDRDANNNFCKKEIITESTARMGAFGTSLNWLFPHEYREVNHLERYEFTVPAGYELENVTRETFYFQFVDGQTQGAACRNVYNVPSPLGVYPVPSGTLVTVNVSNDQLTDTDDMYGPCNTTGQTVFMGNLFNRSVVRYFLRPVCADNPASPLDPGPITTSFTNQGIPLVQNALDLAQQHTRNHTGGQFLTLVEPVLELVNNTPNVTVCSENQFCWDVTLLNTPAANQPLADNVYMWLSNFPDILTDNFQNMTITDIASGIEVIPTANGIFQLLPLANGASRQYRICGTFDCNGDPNQDRTHTITVNYGWDCSGYPTNTNDVTCFSNSLDLELEEVRTTITANYVTEPTNDTTCKEALHYSVLIDTEDPFCNVNYNKFTVEIPACLMYTTGSISIGNTVVANYVPPTMDVNSNVLVWDLTSYAPITEPITVNFDLSIISDPNCINFTIPHLTSNVEATTFCGGTDIVSVAFSTLNTPDVNLDLCVLNFTVNKSVFPTNTYAGAPVTFTIEICNEEQNTAQTFYVNEQIPSDFTILPLSMPVYNSLINSNGVTVAANSCSTWVISGYFTTIGECSSHINTVEVTDVQGNSLDASACVKVLKGCPAAANGSGGCAPGDKVAINLSIHTTVPDVKKIEYRMIYPCFLTPPTGFSSPTQDWGNLSTFGILDQPNCTISVSQPCPTNVPSSPCYQLSGLTTNYCYSDIHLELDPAFTLANYANPAQNYQSILGTLFTIDATGVPAGYNVFTTFASSAVNGLNHVDFYDSQGNEIFAGGAWTQSSYINLNNCPNIVDIDAGFSIQQSPCDPHGGVTVNANYDAPGIIHSWTWGDNRTTPINGAVTYTYNYFDPITINTGIVLNPPIPPAAPGTYTITHTIVDLINGISKVETQTVTVSKVDITATASANVVENTTLNLYATSSNGVNFSWTGPNGFTSNLQNPVINNVTVAASGTYTVAATDANGCTASSQVQVAIQKGPVAYYNFDNNLIDNTTNTNDVNPVPVTPLYTSGEINQGYKFTGSNYLTIPNSTDLSQNFSVLSISVWVNPFDIQNNPILIDKYYPSSYYMQLIANGSIEVGGSYPGSYINTDAGLISANNCWQHIVVIMNENTGKISVYINGVFNKDYAFTGTIGINSMPIILGQKNSGIGSYASGQNAYSGVMDELGLWSRVLTSTEIAQLYGSGPTKPQVYAGPDVSTCGNVTLTATGADTYVWSTGATTASITVNPATTQNYTVTGYLNTCMATDNISVTNNCPVLCTLNVDYNYTKGKKCNYIFTDNSTTNGTIISRIWNFGDGATSTLQNPVHTYTSNGTFAVSLTVVSELYGQQCTDIQNYDIEVLCYCPVTPTFSFTNTGCNKISFTGVAGVYGGATVTNWKWDFDDPTSGSNNTSSSINPTHIFTSSGIYKVCLTVTSMLNEKLCKETICQDVLVTCAGPCNVTSLFTETPLGAGTYSFTDNSTSTGVIVAYTWNFDDLTSGANNISNLPNPTHNFATSGPHNVCLTVGAVTSTQGCNNTYCKSITVTKKGNNAGRTSMNGNISNDSGKGSDVGKEDINPSQIIIKPNPTLGKTMISINTDDSRPIKLQISNMHGQIISVLSEGDTRLGGNEFVWEASAELPSGTYIVSLITDTEVLHEKIILIK